MANISKMKNEKCKTQNHSLKLKIEECLLNKKRIVKYISFKYINFQGGANKF